MADKSVIDNANKAGNGISATSGRPFPLRYLCADGLAILIAIYRLYSAGSNMNLINDMNGLRDLYVFFLFIGLTNVLHLIVARWWTLVVSWIPLIGTVILFWAYGSLSYISLISWLKIVLALYLYINDRILKLVLSPCEYVLWKIFFTLTLDDVYQDILWLR